MQAEKLMRGQVGTLVAQITAITDTGNWVAFKDLGVSNYTSIA